MWSECGSQMTWIKRKMLVLLWHHSIYYRRNKGQAMVEIGKPFFVTLLLFGLMKLFVEILPLLGGQTEVLKGPVACEFPSMTPFSHADVWKIPPSDHFNFNKKVDPLTQTKKGCLKGSLRVFEKEYHHISEMMDDEAWIMTEAGKTFSEETYCNQSLPLNQQSPLCLLLQNQILYYPNNSATHSLMQQIQGQIDKINQYINSNAHQEICQQMSNESDIDPKYVGLCGLRNANISKEVEQNGNTKGFDDLKKLTDRTRKESREANLTRAPNMWGVVSFEELPKNLTEHLLKQKKKRVVDQKDYLKYTLIRPDNIGEAEFIASPHVMFLQDLIDWALMKTLNPSQTPMATVYKKSPEKCWNKIQPSMINNMIYCMIVAAFMELPGNFLSQVLVEKQLKLREYLAISGVQPLVLKMSWILFYTLLILPLTVVFIALVLFFIVGKDFMSDYTFFFLIPIGYNINNLAYCYMLSNFFKTNNHSTPILSGTHMLLMLVSMMAFGAGMSVPMVWIARVVSLHPVVPLAMSFHYISAWEDAYIGVQWWNINGSPVASDIYGGIGEAMVWMVVDFFLYIILGWYFEKVFTGEFGQAQPFYFPFLTSFWCPEEVTLDAIDDVNADVESVEEMTPGIVIDRLTKAYESGQKLALNQLTLTFYSGEITAFLGHNGAGKSTAMNCLVGLIDATHGKATVNGFDIKTQMDLIRPQLGFVPQYDILYPDFTVDEHLQFFGWIKGLSEEETKESVNPVIDALGMSDLHNQTITKLSGGQKRKLSIITGYLGNPKTVIFDEPTTGVDPYSRRSIWDAIVKHKTDCTTILSTHFMDEADLLGDRIAIINSGELKCCGTPKYLKEKYGRGYRMNVTRKEEYSRHDVINFITALVPTSKLNEERGVDMEFSLTKDLARSDEIINVMERIEANDRIVSFCINEPTIEDVFFTSIKQENPAEVKEDKDKLEPAEDNETGSHTIEYEKSPNLMAQFVGLLKKRFIESFSLGFILTQNALPLIFIVLLATISLKQNSDANAINGKVTIFHPWRFTTFFMHAQDSKFSDSTLEMMFKYGNPPVCPGKNCNEADKIPAKMGTDPTKTNLPTKCEEKNECMNHCENSDETRKVSHGKLPSGETLYRVSSVNDVSKWIVFANQTKNIIVGGFSYKMFENGTTSPILGNGTWKREEELKMSEGGTNESVQVFYQPHLKLAMVNLWNTYRLRQVTGTSMGIEMSMREERLADSDGPQIIKMLEKYMASCLLVLAVGFSGLGIIVFVINEKTSGLKRLQLLSGASPVIYWVSNLVHDYTQHVITTLIVFLPLYAFESPVKGNEGALILLTLVYGLQSICFAYLLNMFFKSITIIVNIMVMLATLGAVVAMLMALLNMCDVTASQDCDGAFCSDKFLAYLRISYMVPMFMISSGIGFLSFKSISGDTIDSVCESWEARGCVNSHACKIHDTFAMLGPMIAISIAWAVFYFIAVLVLEYLDISKRLTCLVKDLPSAAVTDPDVVNEAQRLDGASESDSLIVRNLKKCYSAMQRPAVSDISFGVHKAETFGLLGVNGAGKTSTFNMLTGFQRPTSGLASILGDDLFACSWSRFRNSSYCPQENTLFPSLTIEQHLALFGALRDIPSYAVNDLAEALINEVGLESHKGKKAGQLSRGNQRKLQLAIALMDYKPVIFLDEPSSGMDPGARRKTWTCVSRAVKRGCSVVLTSHSMEECEALCHRLVIMVAGAFTCIGSVQYLKHKFGDKLIVDIKLAPQASKSGVVPQLTAALISLLPSASLQEQHANSLTFHIQRRQGVALSTVHKVLRELRVQFQIEDVNISQTSLEQVFIKMARAQEEDSARVKGHSKTPDETPPSPKGGNDWE